MIARNPVFCDYNITLAVMVRIKCSQESRLTTPLCSFNVSRMSLPQRKPYDGFQRKLIISFDIGTSFSGVSYVFLIPGETPVIHGVTQ
jgi:hypothetical protein